MSETILALEENEDVVLIEEEKETHRLVLKELPENLRYAFLGENDTKSVIISLILDANMEAQLLVILKKNMDA